MHNHYNSHVTQLQECYEQALEQLGNSEGLLIHSGTERYYYADDQAIPFRAFGHFSHWLPVDRPDQLLLIVPGQRPVYFQVIPHDYWYDQSIENDTWWASEFDIVALPSRDQIGQHLKGVERLAFIGEEETFARSLGIDSERINPQKLLFRLDFLRAYKTAYELQQLRTANQTALQGHRAAAECFVNDGSEYDIHMAYLQACRIIEQDCPYTNIVALNDKAAILHYQHKRLQLPIGQKSQVLLIDAGCRINNYCSDITRTTVADNTHNSFRQLLNAMESLQGQLVEEVNPGRSYIDLHLSAMKKIAHLAVDLELIFCSVEQALNLRIPQQFMPHGVGHLLGIQVHDVGGHLADPDGERLLPPPDYPLLRNTRTIDENMVFTVEPGFYFIPQLLDPLRDATTGKHFNWQLIDELIPLGGIRIEDNVRVVAGGVENLTRG